MGIEGRDQVGVVSGEDALRDGGPPIIPPSRKLIVGV